MHGIRIDVTLILQPPVEGLQDPIGLVYPSGIVPFFLEMGDESPAITCVDFLHRDISRPVLKPSKVLSSTLSILT